MILIAGSSGIIGSFLSKELNNKGYSILGVSDQLSGSENQYTIDLTNYEKTLEFVEKINKPTILIFLIALAHEKGEKKQFQHFKNINFTTLKNLINSLEKQSKIPDKIIFTSSISVYGERKELDNYSEESELLPKSPYAVTKKLAEDFLLKCYKDKTFILRFAPVYSNSFLLNVNRRIKIRNKYFRVGDGNQKLNLLNINNIAFIIEAIINDKVPNGIYNLRDEINYTYNNLLSFFGSKKYFKIPRWLIYLVYFAAKIFQNYRIKENALKLFKNNIYENDRIKTYLDLPYSIRDIKL